MNFRTVISAAALLGASACTPNNAVLEAGDFMVFFSEGTSRTIRFDSINLDQIPEGEMVKIDCRCELANATADLEACEDEGLLGGCTTCEEFIDVAQGLEDPPDTDVYRTDLCWADSNVIYDLGLDIDDDGEVDYDQWAGNPYGDYGDAPRFGYESWVHRDRFTVISQQLDPWRGEAIITTEGDFQVTFHHELPGDDMRFAFVIDPDFQPEICVGDGDNISAEPLDGDWLAEWSEDVDGQLYFLNAGSYQFNPNNVEDAWYLPGDWLSGYGEGKVGEETFFIRGARYGDPFAYGYYELLSSLYSGVEPAPEDLFYIPFEAGDDPVTADLDGDGVPDFDQLREKMAGIVDESNGEFATLQELFDVDWSAYGSDFIVEPKTHANDWREPDGIAAGLDGWGEMHYNWVRIDDGSTLEVGGSASGEFSLLMNATDSQSQMLVRGRFSVDKIKKEKWGTFDVQQERLDKFGTTLCVDTR